MSDSKGTFHPILFCAVEPATEELRNLVEETLNALVREVPTMTVRVKPIGTRLLLEAEDELQLERVSIRLLNEHRIACGEVKVAFRETIRTAAEGEGKYIRQTGGQGNYAHCKLLVEPNEPGMGYEFINDGKNGDVKKGDAKSGVVPEGFIKPVDEGVQAALELGILAGYPMVDVKVILFDGSYHESDSNEMAFRFAGSMAVKEAARKASPVLLEPVMAVEVNVPEELVGKIVVDLRSRRGRIEGLEPAAGSIAIKAIVPLAEVLRSSRHGRPEYDLRFAGYEAVPRRGDGGTEMAGVFNPKRRGPESGRSAAEAHF